jgi:DnaJ-class molecular chaperone
MMGTKIEVTHCEQCRGSGKQLTDNVYGDKKCKACGGSGHIVKNVITRRREN